MCMNCPKMSGVGFYSAYLVADKVEVITKSMQAGSPQLRWESDSGSSFTISDASDAEPIDGSGTRLVLHLKDDAMQYLESSKLEQLLQRYSEFIEFPIDLLHEKELEIGLLFDDASIIHNKRNNLL